jgi:hypothetical protein
VRLLFALALAFCLSPLALRADFEDLGMGARALGMGDAFTGLADDGRAVYYNPAGLARQSRAEVAADYAKLHAGLDDRSSLSLAYLSYVQPLSRRKEPPRALRVEGRALAAGGEGVPAAARGTLGAALRVFSLAGTYRPAAGSPGARRSKPCRSATSRTPTPAPTPSSATAPTAR